MTLVASLRPALRATRVPPIAAVREGATLPESRFARFRTPGSLCDHGARLRRARLRPLRERPRDDRRSSLWMGLGALLIFIGVALFATKLVRPLAAALGEPAARMGGAAGKLARDNARRNPQRTASTAAALMIGLALVTLVATLAAGITNTFRGAVDDLFVADYAITAQNNFSPIPIDAAEAAAEADGVEAVASTRTGEARVFDSTEFVTAVDENFGQVLAADWVEGSQAVFAELGDDGAFVDDGYAEDHDLSIGSPIQVIVPSGNRLRAEDRGHLRPAGRRLAVRARHVLERGLRPRVRLAAEPLHVRPDGGRRDGGEHGGARGRRSPASRTRRRRRRRSSSTTRSAA